MGFGGRNDQVGDHQVQVSLTGEGSLLFEEKRIGLDVYSLFGVSSNTPNV